MAQIWKFITDGVWDIELSSLSGAKRLGVKAIRVAVLVVKGFQDDECPLHASALTYTTLMAIVPILALSLALARGLGDAGLAKEKARGVVREWTQRFGQAAATADAPDAAAMPDAGTNVAQAAEPGTAVTAGEEITTSELAEEINHMVDAAFEKVENISFAALGSVGLVLLLFLVITVLGRVESSFNKVWGVRAGRPVWRKFTDYLTVVLVLPFLVVAASSIPVADFTGRYLNAGIAERLMAVMESAFLKNAAVLGMTSLCFTFLIMFMPNTRVKIGPGLAGGLVAGVLFIGWLWLCATIQVYVAGYGKIYGSFAVVPILLAWLFVSWEIVLFGAEVAFALQNCATYRMEQGAHNASVQSKLILALSIVAEAAVGMLGKDACLDVAKFVREKGVPVRFLNSIIDILTDAGFLGRLSDRDGCFALLKSPQTLTVRDVVHAVVDQGVRPEGLGLRGADPRLVAALDGALRGEKGQIRDMTVSDLVTSLRGADR